MIHINVGTGSTSIMDKWDHLKNNFIIKLTEAWSNDKLPNEIFPGWRLQYENIRMCVSRL